MTPEEKRSRAEHLKEAFRQMEELSGKLAIKVPELKRNMQQLQSELEAQLTQRPTP